ncbi:hypothetical protein [uncultured Sulfitobacter sp.]|uniref:hypothetical protein n=1 Tax=uncultured Sulfitobacter sp. TaxID=191468 RepID=UPI002595A986|nr:hypothetical protein [uncultured Sulfitobacter sp.]
MPEHRVMLPFKANWAQPVEMTLTHKTDIFVADAGYETRRSLRSKPRITLSFSALSVGSQIIALSRVLATSQNMLCICANPTRFVHLTADAQVGDDSLSLSASPHWLDGTTELVAMDSNGEVFELVELTSLNGTAAGCEDLLNPWPEGTRLCQALTGRLETQISSNVVTDAVVTTEVVFNVLPEFDYKYIPLNLEQFDGRHVIAARPNWGSAYTLENSWPVEQVDFGHGRVETYSPIDFPAPTYAFDAQCFTFDETERDLALFQELRGRRKYFYIPTEISDFGPDVQLGNQNFILPTREVYDSYREHPVYRNVEVTSMVGEVIRRNITSIELISGDRTQVNVHAAWGGTLQTVGLKRMSWLLKARLFSDIMAIQWKTDSVSSHKFSYTALPGIGFNDYLALRSTPEDLDRETPAGADRAVIYL